MKDCRCRYLVPTLETLCLILTLWLSASVAFARLGTLVLPVTIDDMELDLIVIAPDNLTVQGIVVHGFGRFLDQDDEAHTLAQRLLIQYHEEKFAEYQREVPGLDLAFLERMQRSYAMSEENICFIGLFPRGIRTHPLARVFFIHETENSWDIPSETMARKKLPHRGFFREFVTLGGDLTRGLAGDALFSTTDGPFGTGLWTSVKMSESTVHGATLSYEYVGRRVEIAGVRIERDAPAGAMSILLIAAEHLHLASFGSYYDLPLLSRKVPVFPERFFASFNRRDLRLRARYQRMGFAIVDYFGILDPSLVAEMSRADFRRLALRHATTRIGRDFFAQMANEEDWASLGEDGSRPLPVPTPGQRLSYLRRREQIEVCNAALRGTAS